jgi:SAM-dependent methyltransferase
MGGNVSNSGAAPVERYRRESWTPQSGVALEERVAGLWTSGQQVAFSYPESGNADCFRIEEKSFWFKHRNACIRAVVRRLPPNGMFVDVGGGNGFVAKGLTEEGFDVALVEPGWAGAQNAWERGVRPVICATLEQAGFPERSIGGIGIFDVLEHIEDDVAFLRNLRRHLDPAGRLYLTVPAFQFLWSAEDTAAGHFRRYSRSTLRSVLERSGMEVEYMSGLFSWLPLPVFLRRSLPSRLGRRDASSSRADRDHALPGNWLGRCLDGLLMRERDRISGGGSLAIGGSLIAVARMK